MKDALTTTNEHDEDEEEYEDEEELESLFAEEYGRLPEADDFAVGVWSLICASRQANQRTRDGE